MINHLRYRPIINTVIFFLNFLRVNGKLGTIMHDFGYKHLRSFILRTKNKNKVGHFLLNTVCITSYFVTVQQNTLLSIIITSVYFSNKKKKAQNNTTNISLSGNPKTPELESHS